MLDEYVFPNVGLIMYGFFWLKFGLWLHSRGLDPREQSTLLLWTQHPGGTAEYTESILYYSLLLVYVDPNTSNIPGKQITRGWLFAKQRAGTDQYDRIVTELETLVEEPERLSGEDLTEAVIAPWFRTRCRERDVNLPARLEQRLGDALAQEFESERPAMEAAIGAFVTTIGEICHDQPSLYENYNTAPINEPFDLTAMLWETDTPARETLANRRVELTQPDVDALFAVLGTFPQGIRMLHSFCFIAYLGPHDSGGNRLRDIHELCLDHAAEIVETAEMRLGQQFDRAVVDDIVATSFYYELNYVVAEAETIARKLLTDRQGLLRLEEVDRFLDARRDDLPVARLENFVGAPESVADYLPGLIEKYDAEGDTDVVAFLQCLFEAIEGGAGPADLLVTLLTQQETLSVFDEDNDIYRIEQPPETTSPATFYGASSMQQYTAELLEATADE
jgi:hypothetical protein